MVVHARLCSCSGLGCVSPRTEELRGRGWPHPSLSRGGGRPPLLRSGSELSPLSVWQLWVFVFDGTDHIFYHSVGKTFSLYTWVMCYCVIFASAYTFAGSLSLKTVFSHLSSPIAHCAPSFTLVAEQVIAPFIDPRSAACTHRTAA